MSEHEQLSKQISLAEARVEIYLTALERGDVGAITPIEDGSVPPDEIEAIWDSAVRMSKIFAFFNDLSYCNRTPEEPRKKRRKRRK